jgi:AraC-like DNA-binding protein
LPIHLVSKLIHERFGKSFTDLVNEYRVREFVIRAGSGDYSAHSILGIAFDVGFSSKSAFNNAFKKITGKTPSEFRKNAEPRPVL